MGRVRGFALTSSDKPALLRCVVVTFSRLRRTVVGMLCVVAAVVGLASPAFAHNSLVTSDPAEGAVLTVAPSNIVLTFKTAITLDFFAASLVLPDGSVVTINGASLATDNPAMVLVPMGVSGAGQHQLRWRETAADGHVIRGTVTFTLETPAALSTAPAVPVAAVVTTSPPTPSATATATRAVTASTGSGPTGLLGITRFFVFVALTVLVGGLFFLRVVWPQGLHFPAARGLLWTAWLVATASAGLAFVFQSAIMSGRSILGGFGSFGAVVGTTVGKAFLLRFVALVAAGWWVRALRDRGHVADARGALVASGIALVTLSFSGHGFSQRWSLVGVVVDLVHVAAVAGWLGGLVVLVQAVIRHPMDHDGVGALQGFHRVATVSVGALVVSGVMQSLRLDRSPGGLFGTGHGRWLLLKLVIVGLMLAVGRRNSRTIQKRFNDAETTRPGLVGMLRRSVATEVGLGVLTLAVTSVLVVSAPASAGDQTSTPPSSIPATGYVRSVGSGAVTADVELTSTNVNQLALLRVRFTNGSIATRPLVAMVRPTSTDDPGFGVELKVTADGSFEAPIQFALTGPWRLEIAPGSPEVVTNPLVVTLPIDG